MQQLPSCSYYSACISLFFWWDTLQYENIFTLPFDFFFFVRMATIRILFALPVFPLACITTKMISLVFRNVFEYVPGRCFYCKYSASAVWSVHLGLHYYRNWMKVANVHFYSLKATLKQLNFSQINYFHLPHHKKRYILFFEIYFYVWHFFSILI